MRQSILFLTTLILLVLGGCSTSNSYYVLSVSPTPQTIYSSRKRTIGIAKISVPHYLYKREIAIAESSSKITLLGNALWGEDLDAGLTSRLIGYLQKKFNQPDVYAYPWGIDRQPELKVSVQITRFIAQGNQVYLDATWRIENMRTKKSKARLFTTSVHTKQDPQSIVSAMNQAFAQFEENVAMGIKNF